MMYLDAIKHQLMLQLSTPVRVRVRVHVRVRVCVRFYSLESLLGARNQRPCPTKITPRSIVAPALCAALAIF